MEARFDSSQWSIFRDSIREATQADIDEGALRLDDLVRNRVAFTAYWGSTIDSLRPQLSKGARDDLDYDEEFLNVDWTLWRSEDRGPWAFIEAENDIRSAYDEISKLACLNAPVRALITKGKLSSNDRWDVNLRLGEWNEQLKRYHQAARLPLAYPLGVIVVCTNGEGSRIRSYTLFAGDVVEEAAW